MTNDQNQLTDLPAMFSNAAWTLPQPEANHRSAISGRGQVKPVLNWFWQCSYARLPFIAEVKTNKNKDDGAHEKFAREFKPTEIN